MAEIAVKREAEVLIQIPTSGMSDEQRKHLFDAENHLEQAGITFDTGMDMDSRVRDWEFDWSLKGASVLLKRLKETKTKEDE